MSGEACVVARMVDCGRAVMCGGGRANCGEAFGVAMVDCGRARAASHEAWTAVMCGGGRATCGEAFGLADCGRAVMCGGGRANCGEAFGVALVDCGTGTMDDGRPMDGDGDGVFGTRVGHVA